MPDERKLAWAYFIWTVIAVALGVLARFTIAAPEPACDMCIDFSFFIYIALAIAWVVGLGVIRIWILGGEQAEWERREFLKRRDNDQ